MVNRKNLLNLCQYVLRFASTKTHYETLGVKKSASQGDIRTAFIELSKKYHPDKQKGDIEYFKKINEAYTVLSREDSRAQYDSSLVAGSPPVYSQPQSYSSFEERVYNEAKKYSFGYKTPRPPPKHVARRVRLVLCALVCFVLATYGMSIASFRRIGNRSFRMYRSRQQDD